MGIVSAVEDFLLNKALGRAAVVVAQAAGSFALAHSGILQSYGVSVSVDPDMLGSGILAGVHVLGLYLAHQFPKVFGFLNPPVSAPAPAQGS